MDRKVMPHNIQIEQALLGAIILDKDIIYKVRELPVDLFYIEAHKILFSAIKALAEKRELIDLITLTEELRVLGNLNDVGGIKYITSLSNSVPTTKNADYYINNLISLMNRRNIIKASNEAIEKAYTEVDDITVLSRVKEDIEGIGILNNGSFIEDINLIEDEDDNKVTRIKTGFKELDKKLRGGFELGTLNVIAGWQGAGKSTLINQMVISESISQGYKVFLYSGELKATNALKWLRRTICDQVHIQEIKAEFGVYYKETEECKKLIKNWLNNKFYLYKNKRNLSLDTLIYHMEILAKRDNVKVFVIDNLIKLIVTAGVQDELMAQTIIVNKLKDFAEDNNVIVHLIAHCKKNGDRSKPPTIEDISGSANIGNLSDYVMCIHRIPEKNKKGESDYDMGIYLYKNRHGQEMNRALKTYFDEIRKRFYTDGSELRKEYGYMGNDPFVQVAIDTPF